MQDEQDIVHRAQRGDKEALAQLYETHFDKVYRYVRLRIGNRTEAEDITQQVFLKAVGAISTFKWKGAYPSLPGYFVLLTMRWPTIGERKASRERFLLTNR